MKQFVVFGLMLSALASPALADKAAYCQAYARDFSDQVASDKAAWQHKYQIALDDCLAANKTSAAIAVKAVAPKPTAQPQAVSAKATTNPPPVVVSKSTPTQKVADNAGLTPGSAEWNDYCAKKYTSFDAKSGLYMSHTGVKRHCLVTKDVAG